MSYLSKTGQVYSQVSAAGLVQPDARLHQQPQDSLASPVACTALLGNKQVEVKLHL